MLATGISGLDSTRGGLEARRLHLIVGEEKSGKTTLALQVASIASGMGFEVLWLDCGGRLHPARLRALASHWGADLSKIRISTPETFSEQLRLIIWACDYAQEPGLIVVDDFTYLHRVEASGVLPHDKWIYKMLAFQSALLKEVTRSRNVTSIVVSDIHERPGLGQPQPVASAIVSYYADSELWLQSIAAGRRLLRLRINDQSLSLRVRIFEGGIMED
jgi:RecA/RadA recombinase